MSANMTMELDGAEIEACWPVERADGTVTSWLVIRPKKTGDVALQHLPAAAVAFDSHRTAPIDAPAWVKGLTVLGVGYWSGKEVDTVGRRLLILTGVAMRSLGWQPGKSFLEAEDTQNGRAFMGAIPDAVGKNKKDIPGKRLPRTDYLP